MLGNYFIPTKENGEYSESVILGVKAAPITPYIKVGLLCSITYVHVLYFILDFKSGEKGNRYK